MAQTIVRCVRLLAAVALVLVPLVGSPSASADPVIRFVPCQDGTPPPTPDPSTACTPESDAVVRETIFLGFEVDAGSFARLRRVELFVLSEQQGVPSPGSPRPGDPVEIWEFNDVSTAPRARSFAYEWRTGSLTPYNAPYTVRVRAFTHSPDSTSSTASRAHLIVDNPPSTPQAPRVVVATPRSVRVEWPTSPEPDVLFYRLHWARTDDPSDPPPADAFDDWLRADQNEVVHEVMRTGAYWYRVQSFRRSVVAQDGVIASPLSARSESPGVVADPTPPPSAQPTPPPADATPAPKRSSPKLTPRPLARISRSQPPLRDAPFSALLPYDLPEQGDVEVGTDDVAEGEFAEDDGGGFQQDVVPGPLPAIAIGTFLVSAALALGRMPT